LILDIKELIESIESMTIFKIQNPISKIRNVLIVADIEGSSGCWDYRASSFMTAAWVQACVAMTLDVAAVVKGLFESGVENIRVKDFHRTAYNLLPELIDPRAEIIHGYQAGPVPGLGDPGNAEAVLFLGMHAASGTGGFLAHTLTSRIAQLTVNAKPLAEIELFAASLAPFGVKPVFFSGCPVACEQAVQTIGNLSVYVIDKSAGPDGFDARAWRNGLVQAALAALGNDLTEPYRPEGPFRARVAMRDGENTARKIAGRWRMVCKGDQIFLDAADIQDLYLNLIRICYLTPLIQKILPFCLPVYNLWGRLGLAWVRRKSKNLKQL
jgi:D-aminopeptidase